jgi:inhibitor of cysteine peptidase
MHGTSGSGLPSRHHIAGAGGALAVALLTLLAAAGPAGATTTVTLGAADSGRTITVDAGTPIEVVLESNASTGFTWEITAVPVDSILAPAPGNGEYTAPDSDLVGAAGVQTFRYETVGEGTTRLALTYLRPWSGEEAGTFAVTIVVRSPSESAMPATSTETSGPGDGLATAVPMLAVLLAALSLLALVRSRLHVEA